jgi:hypothetical protein
MAINLKQAREQGKLEQFIREREAEESQRVEAERFQATLASMVRTSKSEPETLPPECGDD